MKGSSSLSDSSSSSPGALSGSFTDTESARGLTTEEVDAEKEVEGAPSTGAGAGDDVVLVEGETVSDRDDVEVNTSRIFLGPFDEETGRCITVYGAARG